MEIEERIELAVHRTRQRMFSEFPQDASVLLMLKYFAEELAKLAKEKVALTSGERD